MPRCDHVLITLMFVCFVIKEIKLSFASACSQAKNETGGSPAQKVSA